MESTLNQPAATSTAAQRARNIARRDNLLRIGSLVILLIAWEIYGRSVNPLIFAPVSKVAAAAIEIIGNGELWKYLSLSLIVLVQGFGVSLLIGIPLGVLMARVHVIDTILEPYINALNAMPMVAAVPLITVWFGYETLGKTVVIVLFSIFTIILNTYQGVRNVETNLLEVARSFCSTEQRLWGDVVLPSALPYILVGVRLAIGRGLVGMIIAEAYMSVTGIGYLVNLYANSFNMAKFLVPSLTLMLMGVGLNAAVKFLEKRMTPWLSVNREE